MPLILADATVSTAFLVVSYLAIGAAAIVILVALFDPGIRYKISSPETPDNTSGEFTRTLELWTDSKVNQSVDLTVLTNGNVFYEEELASIRSAATSVCLEAYIFKESEIGRRFVEALTERARAGVRVNVVLDALGSASVGKHFFHEFTSSGGKLSWYNSGRWNKLPRFNNRTHRELLIIDGKTGFIGGAGVAGDRFDPDHAFRPDRRRAGHGQPGSGLRFRADPVRQGNRLRAGARCDRHFWEIFLRVRVSSWRVYRF